MLLSTLTLALIQAGALPAPEWAGPRGAEAPASAPVERRSSRPTAAELGILLDLPAEIPGAPMTALIVGSSGPGAYEIVLDNTGTGYKEKFLLQLPPNPSRIAPSPLLVAFHKFGSSAQDIALNTTFEEECFDRNWFLVAPLGAAQQSFSSLASQLNTELVLDLLMDRLGAFIDRGRVYGVGFSMGAGNAMNFAARHVDPTRTMFAAVVNHTGGGSLSYTYDTQPANQPVLEFWFGGPPDDFPFEYARSSVFEVIDVAASPAFGPGLPGGGGVGGGGGGGGLPPATDPELVVLPYRDLIRNLTHVPLYFVRGKFEPTKSLVDQFDALADHFQRIGGTLTLELVPGVISHDWSTLDERKACDWLATFRLRLPDQALTIADRDDRYFHFEVVQDLAGAFTPFAWRIDGASNSLSVVRTANLRALGLHMEAAGLDPSRELSVVLATQDAEPDRLRLIGYPAAPAQVLRDGEVTGEWSYDAARRTLELSEVDGKRHLWQVMPGR
jgi:hypothetical protein